MTVNADLSETSPQIPGMPSRIAAAYRVELGMVLAATILGIILSSLLIGDKSFWLDEGISVHTARDWSRMLQRVFTRDINMSLYYFLLHFWLKLGDSEAIIRGLSALFGVACIPALYMLGQRLFGGRAGAIAALLLAVNPFFIEYAQEARSYTLLLLLVILSTYSFVEAANRESLRFWVIHGVCTSLAVYAHFFAVLVCLTQFISLPLLGRKNIPWKGVATSVATTALLLSPVLLFGPIGNSLVTWIQPPTWHDLYHFFRKVTGDRPLPLLYFLFCTIGLVSTVRQRSDSISAPPIWRGLSVAMWVILPPVLTFAYSLIVSPMFVNRYLIISVPALALLAAAGISRLPRPWMQASVLILVLLLSSRGLHWWYAQRDKSDWRGVTALIRSRAEPGDAAICYAYGCQWVFEYYLNRSADERAYPVPLRLARETRVGRNAVDTMDTGLLENVPAAYERVWLVLHADMVFKDQPDRSIIMDTLRAHYTYTSEHDFPSIRVLLFSKASP